MSPKNSKQPINLYYNYYKKQFLSQIDKDIKQEWNKSSFLDKILILLGITVLFNLLWNLLFAYKNK